MPRSWHVFLDGLSDSQSPDESELHEFLVYSADLATRELKSSELLELNTKFKLMTLLNQALRAWLDGLSNRAGPNGELDHTPGPLLLIKIEVEQDKWDCKITVRLSDTGGWSNQGAT